MGISAALTAAATVAGAAISSNGAQSAAKTQAEAAQSAEQTQLSMFNKDQANLSPYMSAGTGALSQLSNIFGFGGGGATGSGPNSSAALSQLTQMPGYQFGLDQGQQALDRSAASRGLELSGAQLKDSQTFGQGYAQQQAWQPYVNELNSVSGLGENAAAGVGSNGLATGQGVAASQLAGGQASAAGSVAQSNILGSGLSQLASQISPYTSSYGNVVVGANNSGGYAGVPGIPNINYGGLTGS